MLAHNSEVKYAGSACKYPLHMAQDPIAWTIDITVLLYTLKYEEVAAIIREASLSVKTVITCR